MSKEKYCRYCNNAHTDTELTPDNDLGYIPVGNALSGTAIHIRTGDGKPTAIVVSQWDEDTQQNENIAIYNMKYCPECGRKLTENE